MLIKVTVPKGVPSSRLLEGAIAERFSLKKVRLYKYIHLEDAAKIMEMTERELYKKLIHSKTLHGAMHENEVILHPGPVLKYITKKYQKLIIKSLTEGLSQPLLH